MVMVKKPYFVPGSLAHHGLASRARECHWGARSGQCSSKRVNFRSSSMAQTKAIVHREINMLSFQQHNMISNMSTKIGYSNRSKHLFPVRPIQTTQINLVRI